MIIYSLVHAKDLLTITNFSLICIYNDKTKFDRFSKKNDYYLQLKISIVRRFYLDTKSSSPCVTWMRLRKNKFWTTCHFLVNLIFNLIDSRESLDVMKSCFFKSVCVWILSNCVLSPGVEFSLWHHLDVQLSSSFYSLPKKPFTITGET